MQKQNLFAEKASPKIKTSQEIAFDWNCIITKAPGATYDKEYKDYTKKRNKKWVRLEDTRQLEQEANKLSMERLEYKVKLEEAQQEIDKIKHFEDLYIKNIQRLEKERGEWKKKLQSPEFLEALAKLEHEQWMEWSKAIAPEINTVYYMHHLERWKKCWVPYSKLTEEQKEHDRVWARKIIEELPK